MNILKVKGTNKNFETLCKQLEDYQFSLLPSLRDKKYSLTHDLSDILGYVLIDNEKPIASMGIKKVDENTCELVRVFVCEDYRGKGCASRLFRETENLAKSLGYNKIELVVWCDAISAVKFYKKMSFILKEEKSSQYYGGLKYAEFYKYLG